MERKDLLGIIISTYSNKYEKYIHILKQKLRRNMNGRIYISFLTILNLLEFFCVC